MKRFASIVTIVVVVLALSAGPAFASVCAGSDCGPAMACAMVATPSCPMLDGSPLLKGACGHPMDTASRDAVAVPSGHHEPALTVSTIPVVAARPAVALGACLTTLADARAAPHLTAVIRI